MCYEAGDSVAVRASKGTDPKSPPIRVALVEDDEGLLNTLTSLLNATAGMTCAGSYSDAETALRLIPANRPDVVLMDINLPRMNGIECVGSLKQLDPSIQVMMLTMYEDQDPVFESLKAGASGYLVKRTPPEKIVEAIVDLYRGGSPMSPSVARKVVHQFQADQKNAPPELKLLTSRETEVLSILAQGFLYKEIADKLSISEDTVRSHIRSVYDKLHVHSRTEAVVKFLRGSP